MKALISRFQAWRRLRRHARWYARFLDEQHRQEDYKMHRLLVRIWIFRMRLKAVRCLARLGRTFA